MKKIAFITVWLVEDPGAYKNKTNSDIEREILEEMGPVPSQHLWRRLQSLIFKKRHQLFPLIFEIDHARAQ